MLVAASTLLHLPVIDPDTHERLGTIEDCLFDPDRGTFVALRVKKGGLMREQCFAPAIDIHSFESFAVLCPEESLTSLEELPRLQEIIRSRRPLLGQHAETISKSNLGKVVEVTFDESTGTIAQFHTRLLFKTRIFKHSDCVKVTKRAVIIKDDAATLIEESVTTDARVSVTS